MAKQMEVPGTERISNKAIRRAAELFEETRERRSAERSAGQKEQAERKMALIKAMQKEGITQHVEPDGLTIELVSKGFKVKVSRGKPEGEAPAGAKKKGGGGGGGGRKPRGASVTPIKARGRAGNKDKGGEA